MNETNEGTIIVSNVFVGGYGKENGTNIPGEVINFFKDDDGNHYIFLPPYGVIGKDIGQKPIKAILFVRSTGIPRIVEVLGKAEGVEYFWENASYSKKEKATTFSDEEDKSVTAYKKKLSSIGYGGCSLDKFRKCEDIDKNSIKGVAWVSCFADRVMLPKKSIYLLCDSKKKEQVSGLYDVYMGDRIKNCEYKYNADIKDDQFFCETEERDVVEPKPLNPNGMIVYFNNTDDNVEYHNLNEILCCDELWCDSIETYKEGVYVCDDDVIKAIRKQDEEEIYSNMLYYLFSNHKDLLQSFIADVLKLGIQLGENYEVLREKNRVDLCIKSEKFCIILENKIKSGINGIKFDTKPKTDEDKKLYGEDNLTFEDGVLMYKGNNELKIVSQLSKYYLLARKGDEENGVKGYKEEQIYCFLLKPNYHNINLSRYYLGDKYDKNEINYSDVYDCFTSFIKDKNYSNDYPYLIEFTKALYKHTRPTDDEFRNEMLKRMDKVISSKK